MIKFIISIILSLSFSSSLASENFMKLRCFDLFSENTFVKAKKSAPYYAEALDSLNQKYNHLMFTDNISDISKPNLKNLSLIDNISARYKARKLNKVLKELHAFDQFLNPRALDSVYRLEKLATQLEKLSFIIDDSQLQNMNRTDKIAFKQVQHSLLTKGLSEFLFANNTTITEPQKQTLRAVIMAPFKRVYMRWILSPIIMPHLDGAVIPYDIVEKVVWEGYDNSKHLLAPYLKTTNGKYAFNVFSSAYNFLFVSFIVVSSVTWTYDVTTETYAAYNRGVANAEAMLLPSLENAKNLATKNMSEDYRNDALQISIDLFKERIHREPTEQEVASIKQLIAARESVKAAANLAIHTEAQ